MAQRCHASVVPVAPDAICGALSPIGNRRSLSGQDGGYPAPASGRYPQRPALPELMIATSGSLNFSSCVYRKDLAETADD